MSQLQSETWMEAVALGDARAYHALVKAHLPRAYAIARRILLDPRDAEDATQEAFTKVWVKAADWQPGRAAFSTWLYRIVVNCALDLARKRRPESGRDPESFAQLPDDAAPVDEKLVISEESIRIRQAVASLSPAQRSAVTLCYFEEFSNAEAAAIMNIHLKALEGLLGRARKVLRGQLEALGNGKRHAA